MSVPKGHCWLNQRLAEGEAVQGSERQERRKRSQGHSWWHRESGRYQGLFFLHCLICGGNRLCAQDVVVGDIALLEPGEIVPCDGVFLSGHNCRCDESGGNWRE